MRGQTYANGRVAEDRQIRGGTWRVDVYGGILQVSLLPNIELKQESQELIFPPWIGKEVTGNTFYRKINTRARALAAHRQGR